MSSQRCLSGQCWGCSAFLQSIEGWNQAERVLQQGRTHCCRPISTVAGCQRLGTHLERTWSPLASTRLSSINPHRAPRRFCLRPRRSWSEQSASISSRGCTRRHLWMSFTHRTLGVAHRLDILPNCKHFGRSDASMCYFRWPCLHKRPPRRLDTQSWSAHRC